jgi:hypothetical protein
MQTIPGRQAASTPARGLLDDGEVESVDDDFVDGVDAFGESGSDKAAESERRNRTFLLE